MGQPVKVSNALLLEARTMGQISRRSIAGQIEFWATLGKAVEGLLRGEEVIRLGQAGKTRSLSACLNEIGKQAGRKRLSNYLKSVPFPHFESVPDSPDLLIRIEASGKRTVGKFVNRTFQPVRRGQK